MNINKTLQYLSFGLPEDIRRKKDFGDYEGAIRLIDHRLDDPSTPEALQQSLRLQKIICTLLPTEFPYSQEEALTPVGAEEEMKLLGKRQIPGSTAFVPGAAGLILAGEVVRDLIQA